MYSLSFPIIKSYCEKYNYIIIVDGGHDFDCACNDIINCKKFANNNTILVIDDAFHYCVSKVIKKISIIR